MSSDSANPCPAGTYPQLVWRPGAVQPAHGTKLPEEYRLPGERASAARLEMHQLPRDERLAREHHHLEASAVLPQEALQFLGKESVEQVTAEGTKLGLEGFGVAGRREPAPLDFVVELANVGLVVPGERLRAVSTQHLKVFGLEIVLVDGVVALFGLLDAQPGEAARLVRCSGEVDGAFGGRLSARGGCRKLVACGDHRLEAQRHERGGSLARDDHHFTLARVRRADVEVQ